MTSRNIPWYSRYPQLSEEVASLRDAFRSRCKQLGHDADPILGAFNREFLARAVHESNWQEGVELELGRTRELASLVMDDLRFNDDCRLDLEALTTHHRDDILRLKRKNASDEEIATVSLARAHILLGWIAAELANRQSASLAHALARAEPHLRDSPLLKADKEASESISKGLAIIEGMKQDPMPVYGPLQGNFRTTGEMFQQLMSVEFDTLLNPMDVRYIHALHRIAMMGVLPSNELGRWRRGMVHVSNPSTVFPPPEVLEARMREYCLDFPRILPGRVPIDPIVSAAKASYEFVRIHPYPDGNGRVSRLLMNLLLYGHHPMVSLAPRAKERHRYRQAILRGDRGKTEPLACLIAISIRDAYTKMLDALGKPSATRSKPRLNST